MIVLKVLGSELCGESWRQTMMKELAPHIPAGVTLGITDDDFGSAMLDYIVDGTIEMINQHHREHDIRGQWSLIGPDLYFDTEEMN